MLKFLVNAVLLQVACIQTVFGTFSPEETKTLLERLLNVPSLHATTSCKVQLTITCWASCTVTSLCYGAQGSDGYIYCHWNKVSSNNSLTYKASVRLHNSIHHFCNPPVTCHHNDCDTFIFSNDTNCYFITMTEDIYLGLKIESDLLSEDICTASTKFNPCNKIKLDAPSVKILQDDDHLTLTASPPECVRQTWITPNYMLIYATSNGVASEELPQIISSYSSFTIPKKEATKYNFTLISSIEETPKSLRVWGQPLSLHLVTKPNTATDNLYIDLQCVHTRNGYLLLARWQKTGYVDKFTFSIRAPKTNMSIEKYVDLSRNGKFFVAKVHHLQLGVDYIISLSAENEQGRSAELQQMVNHNTCDQETKVPKNCTIKRKGFNWIEIKWTAPTITSFTAYQVRTERTNESFSSDLLDTHSTSYNVTGLRECTMYTLVTKVLHNDLEIGACSLQSYTKQQVPATVPAMMISNVSSTSFLLQLSLLTDFEACGEIYSYDVIFNTTWQGKPTSRQIQIKVRQERGGHIFENLQPNTKYFLQVRANNAFGKGPLSPYKIVKTDESAPSTPPKLYLVQYLGNNKYEIQWKPPEEPNGDIFSYQMKIDIFNDNFRNQFLDTTNKCNYTNKTYICYWNSSEHATILELPKGTKIQVKACTGNGSLCSDWSTATFTQEQDWLSIALIASISSVLLLMITTLIVYFYYKRHCKVLTKPKIQQDVLDSLEKKHLRSKTEGSPSANTEATQEEYESVLQWRKHNESEKFTADVDNSAWTCSKKDKSAETTTDLWEHSDTVSMNEPYVEMPHLQKISITTHSDEVDLVHNGIHFSENKELSNASYRTHETRPKTKYLSALKFDDKSGDSGMESLADHSALLITPLESEQLSKPIRTSNSHELSIQQLELMKLDHESLV